MEKILFVSLGCDKNLVDSEQMLGLLSENGFEFTDDENEADAIVINSCCFIGDAKEESINTIIELGALKETGKLKCLIVTGCLAQRYSEEIKEELPEVDAVLGTTAFDDIVACVKSALSGKSKSVINDVNRLTYVEEKRSLTTGGHYAYLKIADGCDKRCSYCIIPSIRGNYRSVPMEILLRDAQRLADKGVKELVIVAQETTVYGTDLYGSKKLPELLRELAKISGINWIRLMYCYPEEITDELIEVIATEKKICHYIDIPIQSGSDNVLRRMGRRTNGKDIRERIAKLRARIPDIALRTSLISGFPGETNEDHEQTMALVDEIEFDRLGVFTYSPEEGTRAYEMPDQIDEEVKLGRRADIMELQQEIAFEKESAMTGREMIAFVEGRDTQENVYVARTYRDAPGVDGLVFVKTDENLMSGDFIRVKITGSYEYDLIGELI